MNIFAYWFSDAMVLRMYNAQEVDAASAPQFYGLVQELSQRAGLPMPRVYLIDEAQPNAFATGRNPEHAAVAATTGILQLLTARELRGVMAHELTHVKHRDILISTIAATVAGAISSIAQFGFLFGGRGDGERANPVVGLIVMILAPIAAMLIQMAISRAREFEADRGGAEISRRPERARRCAGENGALRQGPADGGGRRASGDGADDDHQPALRRRHAEPVQHPPRHRDAHRPLAGDGVMRRPACGRWPDRRRLPARDGLNPSSRFSPAPSRCRMRGSSTTTARHCGPAAARRLLPCPDPPI